MSVNADKISEILLEFHELIREVLLFILKHDYVRVDDVVRKFSENRAEAIKIYKLLEELKKKDILMTVQKRTKIGITRGNLWITCIAIKRR